MNFHVASRGVTFNFGKPAGRGGHVLSVPLKSFKIYLARFARSVFIN